jgi:cytochrome c-type biogenesis protein CcmH
MRQMQLLAAIVLAIVVLAVTPVIAADTPLADAALESRARDLMKEVRCVVCQSQSIDESDAGIAVDLRHLIREEIAAGKSDDEIRQFLVARYGDFILFRPPFKAETLVLWLGPFAVLIGGFVFVIRFLRRRPAQSLPTALNPDEMRRVSQALAPKSQSGDDS